VSLQPLDHDLVSAEPAPLFMGALPRSWQEVPTRVVINMCGVGPFGEGYGRAIHTFALLDVLDVANLPDRHVFESFLDAVHQHAQHEPTYWHCHAGLNRSGLAVAAYLHRHRGVRISDAIASLRDRRSPMVLCNSLFDATLRRWYGEDDEQDFTPVDIERYLAERQGRRP